MTTQPFFRPIVLLVDCEVCEQTKPGATRQSGLVVCDGCYQHGVADEIIDADGYFVDREVGGAFDGFTVSSDADPGL